MLGRMGARGGFGRAGLVGGATGAHVALSGATVADTATVGTVIGTLSVSHGPALIDLAPAPQAFDNAAWSTTLATVTPNNVTAPDGTLTADSVLESGNSNIHTTSAISVAASSTYMAAVYVKRSNIQWFAIGVCDTPAFVNGAVAWFDIQNGVTGTTLIVGTGYVLSNLSIQAATNGFYRVSAQITATGTSLFLQFNSATGNGSTTRVASGAYALWQADFETGFYTYSLTSNPGGLFSITGNSLQVAAALTAGSDAITVQATNGAGSTPSAPFLITVTHAGAYVPTFELLGF